MSSATDTPAAPARPHPHPTMPNALAGIRYNTMNHSDVSTPSDDESASPHDFPPEDAQSLVGVSIGQAQTHFTSPTTPAAEKAAAMDDLMDGPFGDTSQYGLEGTSEIGLVDSPDSSTPTQPGTHALASPKDSPPLPATPRLETSPKRMPSPWRSGPKVFQRSDDIRQSLRESFAGHRRRASSGSQTDGLKKRLTFNMPKSPNLLNFSFPGWSSNSNDTASGVTKPRAQTLMAPSSPRPDADSTSKNASGSNVSAPSRRSTIQNDSAKTSPHKPPVASQPASHVTVEKPTPTPTRPPVNRQLTQERLLRRSASDESLVLYRTLSRASSLGDDSRFEHVSEQVNSRLKAIKDSWQDANFKLPGMPSMPTMPTINISSSLTDLTRGRSGSLKGSSTSSSRKPTPSPLNLSRATVESAKKSPRFSGTTGMTPASAAQHPFFTKAVQDLMGDVVILGGYRGSILRSAEPPHRQLWVPIKVGLNLRKVDLEVGLNPEDDETMEERVIPGGMLTHVGPVDIARRLFKRLRASDNARNGELRVHEYSYDWRLSPHLLSRKLIQYLEKLPCNQPDTPKDRRGAIVIAHSLGGLITRHAINQRPDLFSGVVYAGTPNTCVNILGPLRNGDDVLLSSRVLTAQVNFTIRTSFALLPLDGKCFFNKHTKEEYPIDFFDPQVWIDNALSPVVATPLPPLKDSYASGITGIMSSMASVLPNLPSIGRKGSISRSNGNNAVQSEKEKAKDDKAKATSAARSANAEAKAEGGATHSGMAPQMGGHHPSNSNDWGSNSQNSNPATAVTLPRDAAIAYLTRTLAEVKRFKEELAFQPTHGDANAYPPAAVIYGKSIPTVYGARVAGREHICRTDCYDELAFASGDGVVLARAAQVPAGYSVVRGGVVSSDRGHVTLLGDLEAMGRCLGAVVAGRKAGVGMGVEHRARSKEGEVVRRSREKEKEAANGRE